jgi:hypothetical protein
MYTVEIDISDWNNTDVVTIETDDFEKVHILQEFIAMQIENGWTADYEITLADDEEEDKEEDEGDEPSTISTHVITTIENDDPSTISTVVVKTGF